MNMSMLCDGEVPPPKSSVMKGSAAEVKNLGPALLHVWEEMMDNARPTHRNIKLALRCSTRMDAILHAHVPDVKLPTDVAAEFVELAFLMCGIVSSLGICFWTVLAIVAGYDQVALLAPCCFEGKV